MTPRRAGNRVFGRLRLVLPLVLAAMVAVPAARAGRGGPDSFGYTWHDVNDGCTVEADAFLLANSQSFFDGVTVRNFLGPFDVGFDFPFYDRTTRQIWVNRSGLIFFEAPADNAYATNQAIPTPALPGGFLAPFWDLLALDGPVSVWWEQFPALGYFKISYQMRPQGSANNLQYEVYLYRSGDMRIEYLAAGTPPDNTFTIGQEHYSLAAGLQIMHNGTASGGLTYGTPMPFSICIDRAPTLDCAPATPIACGVTSGRSPAAIVRNVQGYGCAPGMAYAGRETIYTLTITELVDLTATLSGTGARRMSAFLLSGCDEYICLDGGVALSASGLGPGTYYLVVDAETAGDEGTFTLDVACTPLSAPIACEAMVTDSTVGGPSRMNGYACLAGDFSGPEQYYVLDFVPPGNINVSLSGAGPGMGVFIFDATRPFDPIECVRGGLGGTIVYDPAPGSYLIVVDGPAGGSGFTLAANCQPEIQCTGATLACNSRVTATTLGRPSFVDFYRCNPTQRYPGPEAVYSFTNPVDQVVSIQLDDTADARLDLLLLSSCNEGACVEIADNDLSTELPAGTYYLAVDSRGTGGVPYDLAVICGNALEPAFVSFAGEVGDCFDEHKTAWLTPEIAKADVLFTIDLTGSMSQERAQLQINMQDIIDRLQTFIRDVEFGLVSYKDYSATGTGTRPCPYTADSYGSPGDYPYQLEQPITSDRVAIQDAVNTLPIASGGNDGPESYTRVLYETYSDPAIGWRGGARRIVVDFGDELPHDCNILECLGGTSFARGIDLGRDGRPDTGDELEIMDVIQGMVAANIVLLHLETSGFGTDGAFTYTDIWDCWAAMTGGEAVTLNPDGTVPMGIDLAQLIGDLIQERGFFCEELELVASVGFENWLVTSSPIYFDEELPTVRDFDIRFCIPPGTPAGSYDFQVHAICSGAVVATQQVHVDVGANCAASVVTPPADATICEGGSAMLDATGLTLVNCGAAADYEWTDGAGVIGTTATIVVSPADTTSYDVTISCPTDPACEATATALVEVHLPPILDAGSAADVAPCNLGIELTWPAPRFRDPTASGVVNVYRSETSCADALLQPPVVEGLTGLRWVDEGTRPGATYYYVLEAEDARLGTVCVPSGPNNGGAVDRYCLPAAVQEVAQSPFPDGVYTTLFLRHDRTAPGDRVGHEVTLSWPSARPLLAGEHFHLLKALDSPVASFDLAVPEAYVTRSFTETDTRSRLQFFDLRVANRCEELSVDEYPPGS